MRGGWAAADRTHACIGRRLMGVWAEIGRDSTWHVVAFRAHAWYMAYEYSFD